MKKGLELRSLGSRLLGFSGFTVQGIGVLG